MIYIGNKRDLTNLGRYAVVERMAGFYSLVDDANMFRNICQSQFRKPS